MPSLSVIRAGLAELRNGPPLVVAIAGGTTGIGSYIAKALATTFASNGSKLRVYIIGRNAARAETVLVEGRKISPGSEWRFLKATDLTLISEVDRCCDELTRQESEQPFSGGPASLDVLYMTAACNPLKESVTTSEGLNAFFTSVYYSRIRMTMQLLPLLRASPRQSHVISVYAGSFEEVKPNEEPPTGPPSATEYSMHMVRRNTVFMKNFMFEQLAEKNAGKVSFIHIFPGLVDGPVFWQSDQPLWFKIMWRVMYPIAWLFIMISPEVCGQVMVYLATAAYPAQGTAKQSGIEVVRSTNGEIGGGSYAVGKMGDAPNKGKSFQNFKREDFNEKIWDNTVQTLEKVAKENAAKK